MGDGIAIRCGVLPPREGRQATLLAVGLKTVDGRFVVREAHRTDKRRGGRERPPFVQNPALDGIYRFEDGRVRVTLGNPGAGRRTTWEWQCRGCGDTHAATLRYLAPRLREAEELGNDSVYLGKPRDERP